jgi:hypothetical protein
MPDRAKTDQKATVDEFGNHWQIDQDGNTAVVTWV